MIDPNFTEAANKVINWMDRETGPTATISAEDKKEIFDAIEVLVNHVLDY